MMTDEAMTAAQQDRRDANTEPKADLNIDTWSQNPCLSAVENAGGRVEGQAEIAHYLCAVERNARQDARIQGVLC